MAQQLVESHNKHISDLILNRLIPEIQSFTSYLSEINNILNLMNLHLDTRKHIDDSIKVKELFAEEVDLLKDLKGELP